MTVESATYINSLNEAYPPGGDLIAEGDDHIRLLKTTLKNTFPGRGGADSRVISKAAGYTPAATEVSAIFVHTAGLTVSLPAVSGVVAGGHYLFWAQSGTTTLTPNGADLINGQASLSLGAGEGGLLFPISGGWGMLRMLGSDLAANRTLGNLTDAAAARANLGIEAAVADLASAATVDLGAAVSQNVRITGTTTITSFGTAAAGVRRNVRFAAALTLTYNATSMLLPGSANIAVAAGDRLEAMSLGSGNWEVQFYQRADGTALVAPSVQGEITGAVKDYLGSTAPSGYVFLSGRTIGSASSGATERANADCQALFELIWDSIGNTEAPVPGGRGASAAADWAADKTITLPDARGRVIAGKDNMSGTTASRLTSGGSGIVGTTLGAAGGTQTHTLTAAQSGLPSHSHTTGLYVESGSGYNYSGLSSVMSNATSAFSSSSAGGTSASQAHQNTQPTLVLNKIVKL